MTGREFVVAAAKVADVYIRPTPYIFKLIVILKRKRKENFNQNIF